MQKDSFIKKATQRLLFLSVFITEAVFRERDYLDKSIDLQVILKLAVWSVSFLFSIFFIKLWWRKIFQIDNVLLIPLLILIITSCFYAPQLTYSLASAFSLIAVLSIFFMASSVLTNGELIRQVILGCTLVAAISIVVFFIHPNLGRMVEWVDGVEVHGKRLSGITGTANAIGYISAICLVALYYYRSYLPQRLPFTYWIFVVINLTALLMSNSRTSMIAATMALAAAGMVRTTRVRLAILFSVICLGFIFLAFADMDSLFSMLSRSGDAREIETGTSRTVIWASVVRLIGERPALGWGYAASSTILPEVVGNVGFHAHNAFLQVALSIGFIGLFLFVAILAIKLYYAIKSKNQLHLSFIVFLLIDGLTEPIAFQGPATATALVLATTLALNYKENNEADHRTYQQRLS